MKEEKILVKIEIKLIGLVINVLKKLIVVDLDNLGFINGIEVFIFGIVLFFDVFGVGFGVVLLGYLLYVLVIVVVFMSFFFLSVGI